MYRPSSRLFYFPFLNSLLVAWCLMLLPTRFCTVLYCSYILASLFLFSLFSVFAWKGRKYIHTCRAPYGCILPFRNENRGCMIPTVRLYILYMLYCFCVDFYFFPLTNIGLRFVGNQSHVCRILRCSSVGLSGVKYNLLKGAMSSSVIYSTEKTIHVS